MNFRIVTILCVSAFCFLTGCLEQSELTPVDRGNVQNGDGDSENGEPGPDVGPDVEESDSDPDVGQEQDGDGDSDGEDRECFVNVPVAVSGEAPAGYECQADNPPSHSMDGDLSTRAACEGVGATLTFDLGTARPLCSLAIAWHQGDGRTNEFEIQTSIDGASYSTYEGPLTSELGLELQEYAIYEREARFVRIVFLGNSVADNDWMSVTQVQIASEEQEPSEPADPGDPGDPADPVGPCDPDVLLHNETFEGNQAWQGIHQQFGTSYAFNVVSSPHPVFAGDHSGRFELRFGDPITSNGIRAEVLFPPQDHNERWYAMAAYFPSDDFESDHRYAILSQWHQGSGSGTPTATFRARDDTLYMVVGDSARNPNNLVWYDIGPQTKDVWHHFVWRFIHGEGSAGLMEMWHNGEPVLTINGGNMNNSYNLPRWKVGLYKSSWQNGPTDTDIRVFYVDNVRMGDETATVQDMINCP